MALIIVIIKAEMTTNNGDGAMMVIKMMILVFILFDRAQEVYGLDGLRRTTLPFLAN